MNIIEELFFGNVDAQSTKTHLESKLKNKLKALSEKEELLRNNLSEEKLQMFNEYVNLYNEFSCMSCEDSFISGFKLGARFIYDAFN